MDTDIQWMRLALRLARRGYGTTSPNPMVGAVLVRRGQFIGQGWHRCAGGPHAEIEALRDASQRGERTRGSSLYVTLEPCSTHGRTPPCTEAIIQAGIKRVVVAAIDPNPRHCGRGLDALRRAGIEVVEFGLKRQSEELNEAFNHWIVHRTPFVTVKAAMTLDGKIATAGGESKWITGEQSRAMAMRLRQGADAILVGISTVLADDPRLTVRLPGTSTRRRSSIDSPRGLRRVVLDSRARTPLTARIVTGPDANLTTIFVTPAAPRRRVDALARQVRVVEAPADSEGGIDCGWVLKRLGVDGVTHLLVEGGGEVNASFILGRHAQRVAFFYAPMILGGRKARKAVGGGGADSWSEVLGLSGVRWKRLGPDLFMTARVEMISPQSVPG